MMKVIAIDLGLKRIGLAYSGGQGIVTPLEAVERKNRNQASAAVKKIIDEWEADAVVVGIPMAFYGSGRLQRPGALPG